MGGPHGTASPAAPTVQQNAPTGFFARLTVKVDRQSLIMAILLPMVCIVGT